MRADNQLSARSQGCYLIISPQISIECLHFNESNDRTNFCLLVARRQKNKTQQINLAMDNTVTEMEKMTQNQEKKNENNFSFGVSYSNSQSSNLDEQELDKLVIDSEPENTKRGTAWGYSKFGRWLEKRDIPFNLKEVTAERLNQTLRKFYAEVATEQNQMLTPSSLVGIRAAINRTIISPPYSRSMNIVTDREFVTSNEMFSARCKLYYKTHNKKPQHKASIAKEDMELLKHYFSNSLTDPVKLQEYVCG